MNLTYRGVDYTPHPTQITPIRRQRIGQYRGVACDRAVYDLKTIPQPSYILKYRGVSYESGLTTAVLQPVVPSFHEDSASGIQDQPRPVHSSRYQQLTELGRIHNQFLLKKLEQRIASAQQRGDAHLIALLERERSQLA
ncbi:DUF4278 domain-containing protein [Lyngbya confervoides]|uniref:DUF4278 domain-containing protein n=1 Tax=Lyngbya confervoides BDU141951 TaxID=1574623 RepID=A0ABD4T7V1_9CYAN|nr:DUF4278 domain-containing protein [Lyngbya confervoides]MCM1984548.1 DUF4278 domain-containing protein [Lyngbya confervoides BDU141951]